jgi:hypothetical protein
MNPAVQQAVGQIQATFANFPVAVVADGAGGAYVRIDNLSFGTLFEPAVGWVAFHVSFNYPHADIYPHYLPPDLKRHDGKPMGQGFSKNEMKLGAFTGPATMVSRRASRWNPGRDTAVLKLAKVLEWIRSQ